MCAVEEADGVSDGGEREEGSVAYTRPCGRVRGGNVSRVGSEWSIAKKDGGGGPV